MCRRNRKDSFDDLVTLVGWNRPWTKTGDTKRFTRGSTRGMRMRRLREICTISIPCLDSFVFMVKFYSGEKERKIVLIFDYARIMKGKIDRVILFGFSFNL